MEIAVIVGREHQRLAEPAQVREQRLVELPAEVGILVRRGSRLAGLGAALPPLLVYFVCYFVFQGLGDKNRISPLLAAYAPDLFLSVLAFFLLWGITRR